MQLLLQPVNTEMMSLFICMLQLLSILQLASGVNISMPGCIDHCGGVKIPYPFGVGPNCYHDKSYEIICNYAFHPPKPFLGPFNLVVLNIQWPASSLDFGSPNYQLLTVGIPRPNLCEGDGAKTVNMTAVVPSYDLRGSPYMFSWSSNVLMMEGCGGSVVLKNRVGEMLTGCASVCVDAAAVTNRTTCFGVGCCRAPLSSTENYGSGDSKDLDYYEIVYDLEQLPESYSCNTSAALIDSESVETWAGKLSNLETFPTVLEWRATYLSSSTSSDNVTCSFAFISSDNFGANPQCSCGSIHEGNPYLPYGCQVVADCHKCTQHCKLEYNHSSSSQYYACEKKQLVKRASVIEFSCGMGLVLLLLGCYWLYRFVKWRKEIKRKQKYFKRNGGLLLQQQMSSIEGVVETTKVFTITELDKATDNFNENRILGQGGQGTVFKGMLVDGRIVAIKKSKKVDESRVEQFINEVVILSHINHRNVVKLLGCCLETEVPILIYEYILNGTLYQHIHGQDEDFHIHWKMRLQVAAESAGAVAYLHSSSSAPIYHRDIKSTNILLDDKYKAKVSDFGTSRTITIEQTHVTTCVQGTYGYLDPEYFQSSQFTEKSDVYSFGVVLVELLTGKKPICPTESGGWISLATEFLSKLEDSSLSDITDARISGEAKEEEFNAVADLARKCLNMNGKQRPTMKEIEMLFHGIRFPNGPILEESNPVENNSLSRYVFSADDDSPAGLTTNGRVLNT